MDFTREPIIETVITPKEGCKLVVRSSKSAGQEEYFVDAVEVVSFGNALFFRSIERPKAFIVPASDYEILEVREARMVLKNVGIDRTIKIGGGRETAAKAPKEATQPQESVSVGAEGTVESSESLESKVGRLDKRREKRRQQQRRRKEREGDLPTEALLSPEAQTEKEGVSSEFIEKGPVAPGVMPQPMFSSLLPPPQTLISETIARYRDNDLFKDAFFSKEDVEAESLSTIEVPPLEQEEPLESSEDFLEALEMQNITLEPSEYGTFEAESIHEGEPKIPEEETDTLDIPREE